MNIWGNHIGCIGFREHILSVTVGVRYREADPLNHLKQVGSHCLLSKDKGDLSDKKVFNPSEGIYSNT